MMNKKGAVIFLLVLAVVGSLLAFYSMNLLMSDLANMYYSSVTKDLISSFPAFILSLDLILGSIYVLRYVRKPQYVKRMTLTYLIILMVFSVAGIVTSILTGTLVYGSMLAPYPFIGYTIICLMLHVGLLIGAVVTFYIAYLRLEKDKQRRKMSVHYVIYTIALCIFFYFAYYHLGAILLMPVYTHWRTFYLTFPFYLFVLVPVALLVHTYLYAFGVYKKHQVGGIIHASVCFGLGFVLSGVVVLLGLYNTQFISNISQVLPLERLATMPIDTVFIILITNGLGLYELIYSILYHKRHKNEENK